MDDLKSSVEQLLALPLTTTEIILGTDLVTRWSRNMSSWFWSEKLWLPEGYTWEELQPENIRGYPDKKDIFVYPLMFGIFMLCFQKIILDPLFFSPIVQKLGIRERKKHKVESNKLLEGLYRQYGSQIPKQAIEEASHSLHWPKRKIERWLRDKKVNSKLSLREKFTMNAFNLLFKTFFSLYGAIILYSKPYVWDLKKCWENYPAQEVDVDIWWYYMIGAAFFVSQTIYLTSISSKVNIKVDIIHHLITLSLLIFSWSANHTRVGAVTLLLHDVNDIFILTGRAFKYLKYQTTTTIIFAIFILVWILTRVVIFPFVVLWSIFFQFPDAMTAIPATYLFKCLLLGIFTLNMRWTILIAAMIYRRIVKGVVEEDRSDESLNECEKNSEESDMMNGHADANKDNAKLSKAKVT